MPRASTPTLLPLDTFAQIMGINPAHFSGGYTDTIMGIIASCSAVWWQHAWQASDRVSREDLAIEIATAEREVAEVLGFWPAPHWIENEVHMFPRHHRRDVIDFGLNIRGYRKSVIAKWGKFIEQGQRAVELVGTPSDAGGDMVFSDEDGDGFDETVTLTVNLTTVYDSCQYKVYFANRDGARQWEIRPRRSVDITAGVLTITLWAWQVIDPDQWEALPNKDEGVNAINLTEDVYVTSVDVYREYNDPTALSARFFWEPELERITVLGCPNCGSTTGSSCPTCSLTYQDGCAFVRDVHRGIVVPTPATYDDSDARWEEDTFTICREPDQVKINYYAGDIDDRYLSGETCDPMPLYWAQAVTWLAATRVERPFCMCSNVQAMQARLRVDLAQANPDGPNYFLPLEEARNPFGTRRGEVMAWKRLRLLSTVRARAAVV